jgi:hypothetical protein
MSFAHHGDRASDVGALPVRQAIKFELAINLKTGRCVKRAALMTP